MWYQYSNSRALLAPICMRYLFPSFYFHFTVSFYSLLNKIFFSIFIRVFCVCAQSCPTLCKPMDCSLHQAPSVHGIFQAITLEWVAIPFSRGFSWSRDWICVSCVSYIGRQTLYHSTTWEAPFWSTADVPCCVSFRYTAKWISYTHAHSW